MPRSSATSISARSLLSKIRTASRLNSSVNFGDACFPINGPPDPIKFYQKLSTSSGEVHCGSDWIDTFLNDIHSEHPVNVGEVVHPDRVARILYIAVEGQERYGSKDGKNGNDHDQLGERESICFVMFHA
jgi:hypothetical protein